YTGAFTDWLTVSGAYGFNDADAATTNNLQLIPSIVDQAGALGPSGDPTCSPSAPCFVTGSNASVSTVLPFGSEREFYRADVDVFFDLMGEHHVRFGFDHEDTIMNQTSKANGGTGANSFLDGGSVTLRNTAVQ